MKSIPFIKSTTKIEQTTTSDEDRVSLGAQVAELYQSLISSSSPISIPTKSRATKDIPVSANLGLKACGQYCTTCDMEIVDPAHYHGTAHLISSQRKPNEQDNNKSKHDISLLSKREGTDNAVAVSRLEVEHGRDKAIQLMKRQGWRYGQGLGKANQGTRYPIATVWKQDRLGVGHSRTDRRRITHPSITKKNTSLKKPISSTERGKKLASDAKAEAALRSAMLHYMNH